LKFATFLHLSKFFVFTISNTSDFEGHADLSGTVDGLVSNLSEGIFDISYQTSQSPVTDSLKKDEHSKLYSAMPLAGLNKATHAHRRQKFFNCYDFLIKLRFADNPWYVFTMAFY